MRNDVVAFKSWLDAYGQSWENHDPEAAAALFTENGTYQVTPFLEPIYGRKAIFEYWSEGIHLPTRCAAPTSHPALQASVSLSKYSPPQLPQTQKPKRTTLSDPQSSPRLSASPRTAP